MSKKALYVLCVLMISFIGLKGQSKVIEKVIKYYQPFQSEASINDSLSIYYRCSFIGNLKIYFNDSLIYMNESINYTPTLDRVKACSLQRNKFKNLDNIRIEVNNQYTEEVVNSNFRFIEVYYKKDGIMNLTFHNMDIYAR